MTIADLADYITIILQKCLGWVTLIVQTIENNTFLLLCVLIPFVSIGISLLKKLLTVKS